MHAILNNTFAALFYFGRALVEMLAHQKHNKALQAVTLLCKITLHGKKGIYLAMK
jgi:hypothetical protein